MEKNIATNGRMIVGMMFLLSLFIGQPDLAFLCLMPVALAYFADIFMTANRFRASAICAWSCLALTVAIMFAIAFHL